MDKKVNSLRGEILLLGLTTVFLCVLLGIFWQDRKTPGEGPGAAVETEIQVPQSEIVPDLTPLDLNTATAEELMELPGIGEELASRILKYRAEHGAFETVEEMMEVPGIGEGKFADLEGRIAVK